MPQAIPSPSLLPLLCATALGLLLFGLSMAITFRRLKTKTLTGSSGDPRDALTKLVRTQANTAEYVAALVVPILWLGTRHPPLWVLAMMVIAVLSRYLFAFGMLISPSIAMPNMVRALGAGGTYIAGIGLYLALLFY